MWLFGNNGNVTKVYETCTPPDSSADLQQLLAEAGLDDAEIADECLG
jgi:hypothetical protein